MLAGVPGSYLHVRQSLAISTASLSALKSNAVIALYAAPSRTITRPYRKAQATEYPFKKMC